MTTSCPCLVASGRRRAFSLLEILVAVSLLVVMMVGLLAMFSQTQRAMRTGITQVDVMEGGRVALELISRDLQEMAPTKVTNVVNFYAGINPAARPVGMDLPAPVRRMNQLYEFFFLSQTNLDDWVGTGFRVDDAGEGVGTLYRFRVATGRRTAPSYQPSLFFTGPITNRDGSITIVTNYTGTVTPRFQPVLSGVVHLKVSVFNSRGEPYVNPQSSFDPDIQPTSPRLIIPPFFFLNKRVPAYVDIELGVLEPAVYQQYRQQPLALRQRFLETKAGRVHVFRQRIPIRTGS
jgi:hypothetical protein